MTQKSYLLTFGWVTPDCKSHVTYVEAMEYPDKAALFGLTPDESAKLEKLTETEGKSYYQVLSEWIFSHGHLQFKLEDKHIEFCSALCGGLVLSPILKFLANADICKETALATVSVKSGDGESHHKVAELLSQGKTT